MLEYFGYGFGFVGLTLFMMQQVAAGPHQMAHYAFASGIMNLGVMLPGMMSGYVSDWLGYKLFFIFVLVPAELLCRIVIPKENYDGWSGHYIKYAQRNAMDIATLGVSCLVRLSADKRICEDAVKYESWR